MRDLRTLPKAELHIHLEGAMRVETVRELAERDGSPLPSGLTPDGWRFDGFLDFIDQYIAMCGLMTHLEDFRRLGMEATEDLAANGVRYAEAVFTPSAHAAAFDDDWTSPLEALLDGLAAGARAHGTVVRVTPDVVRDLGVDAAERTLEVARKFVDDGVVGLNCAGSERSEIAPFAAVFRAAKDAGLRSVPHAGEWAGPDNVWRTLAHFEPDRIGHGVRSIEDPRLVDHLATEAIPLEISPLSNIATGVYASLEDHPFLALRDAGVVVTLNSDDPAMFGAWITDVYEEARVRWRLRDEDLAALAGAAVRASFADDGTKAAIERGIESWLSSP
ncbi:MAG: adenosine deaminase [Actinomycetota bacterium]|nr:adenosine deaminase [Actinomycetota bacterium]MDH5223556.1 adenosine deaminase [Actinomycetota bacterium]MDH5312447.1 adenosine deaminase [Actinomycetota bacterium]